MYGNHPDVIFAEARLRIDRDPYVTAMAKFRRINNGDRVAARVRRKMMLSDPDRFDLTADEIAAVSRVR